MNTQAASTDVPAISFQRLCKTYGEGSTLFQALSDVDLDIQQGEFVAIMGPAAPASPRP
jgi:putative ABC transport system ATP-binding protein